MPERLIEKMDETSGEREVRREGRGI